MGDTLPPTGGGMPWKECHVMDERLRFVARLLEGEKMARLCGECGISRRTGYKIFDRYKDCGVGAFNDRSRRPHRQANRLPPQLEAVIVRLKRESPGWARRRFARSSGSEQRPLTCRQSAPSMRSSTGTAWCTDGGAADGWRWDPSSRRPVSRMRCGAPTTKVNSCWAIGGTVIRSPLLISPVATC